MPRSVDILLVEDCLEDVRLIKQVLGAQKLFLRFFVVRDADEAIRFMKQEGVFELMPTPDLVLLDWKLPTFAEGERVLAAIRADSRYKTLSVVMVSAHIGISERRNVMGLGATYCIEKPLDFNKFLEMVNQIDDLWFTIVRRPNNTEEGE